MTLDKAHELITMRNHGQEAVVSLSREYELGLEWKILSGTNSESVLKS